QLERSLRLIQCGLLLLFFLFERRLGLAWRSPVVLIRFGLGISASISLISSFLLLRMPQWDTALNYVDYLQAVVIVSFWTVCFYMREPNRKTVHEDPSKLIFQRWNDVLVSSRFGNAADRKSTRLNSSHP